MRMSGLLMEKGLHAFDDEGRVVTELTLPRIWIVVMDRGKGYIYHRSREFLENIANFDAKRHEGLQSEQDFVREFCGWLEGAFHQKAFDRLVIVASAQSMNHLHECLAGDVRAGISAEIMKDFSGLDKSELASAISKIAFI